MLDFTYSAMRRMYEEILNHGYEIIPFADYITGCKFSKAVILRHDVDNRIKNALKSAVVENELDIRGSYYIRYRKHLFNAAILKKIADLGHEIGYHYEDLSAAKGDYAKAIRMFTENLEHFRAFYSVKTICMHGSPLSKWDNRMIWKRYDYHDFGIVGEPYFDVDYNRVLYITDTGRRWDGGRVSLRDKVESHYCYGLKSTFDIIAAFRERVLPDQIMINIHPHSWHDDPILWLRELTWQSVKNMVKYVLIRRGTRSGYETLC